MKQEHALSMPMGPCDTGHGNNFRSSFNGKALAAVHNDNHKRYVAADYDDDDMFDPDSALCEK